MVGELEKRRVTLPEFELGKYWSRAVPFSPVECGVFRVSQRSWDRALPFCAVPTLFEPLANGNGMAHDA